MRKFIFALMASLLSCSAVSAFWQEAVDSSLKVGVGYRRDNIKWKRELSDSCSSSSRGSGSSSSSGNSNEIKSDLKWKDLDIWLIEGRGKYVTCDNIYMRGSVDYGWITSGKIKHKLDFDGQRDQFEDYFDSSKHHVRGNVWDGKLAIGYQFKWCDEALSFTPVVGYSWHGNELRNSDNDSYSCSSPISSSSSSSSSSYGYDYSSDYSSGNKHRIHQRWIGPFVGIDLDYRICCDWNLFLGYEYHWADYHAKEKNPTTAFDTLNTFDGCGFDTCSSIHIHGKNAWGNVLAMGVEWELCDWTVALRGEFQWWEARNARERRKVFDASCASHFDVETVLKTRIKEVTWNSGSIVLDFGLAF